MTARMPNPVFVLPDALPAMQAFGKVVEHPGVPKATHELAQLRASQINGCGVCVDMHAKMMRKAGETDERIIAVAAWRDTPYFTEAERAALALAECITRFADKSDPVPDEVWAEVVKHYDEGARAALILSISLINVWNRLNGTVRQPAGQHWN